MKSKNNKSMIQGLRISAEKQNLLYKLLFTGENQSKTVWRIIKRKFLDIKLEISNVLTSDKMPLTLSESVNNQFVESF